jgi:hypothetical protein
LLVGSILEDRIVQLRLLVLRKDPRVSYLLVLFSNLAQTLQRK